MCHWLPWRERKTAFHPVIPWTPFLILEPKLKDVMVNAALKLLILHLPEFVPHPYGSSSSLHVCSVAKSYPTLSLMPHGITQTRILEWIAISSPGHHPNPGIESASPVLTGRFFLPLSHLGSSPIPPYNYIFMANFEVPAVDQCLSQKMCIYLCNKSMQWTGIR